MVSPNDPTLRTSVTFRHTDGPQDAASFLFNAALSCFPQLALSPTLIICQAPEFSIIEALDWLDDTPDADTEQLDTRRQGLEGIANPSMSRLNNQDKKQDAAGKGFGCFIGDDEL